MSASGREAGAKKGREGEGEIRSRVFRRVVHQGVGKQGRSTSGSTPVVHDGNALVSMQTGRTPPYLTHNRILTWEVADARALEAPAVVPFPAPPLFLSSPRGAPGPLSCSAAEGGIEIEIEIVILIESRKRVSGVASTPDRLPPRRRCPSQRAAIQICFKDKLTLSIA